MLCVKPRSLLWLWYSPSEGPLLTPNGYLAGRLGRAYLGGYSFCNVLARLGGYYARTRTLSTARSPFATVLAQLGEDRERNQYQRCALLNLLFE